MTHDDAMRSVKLIGQSWAFVAKDRHAEENQYKWLKKKLGKKSRNKVLNGDEDNESFDTKLDEAGSIDRMEEMQSGSFDRSEWRSRMSKRNT